MKNKALSVENILKTKHQEIAFEGKFEKTFGRPSKDLSMIIYGDTTNGKTEASLQLAKYLTNFGTVDYNSLEQGNSSTMQKSITRIDFSNLKNSFRLLDRVSFDETIERISKPKSAQFLFIDSIQYFKIDWNKYLMLKELCYERKKGLIIISQAKGYKNFKTKLADDISFNVDIKCFVKGYRLFPEGRLNGGGEYYDIWPEKSAKFYNEII